MKNIPLYGSFMFILLLISCNKTPSLQEYFVNHQNDKEFIAVDVPSSLLNNENISFSDENKKALESIKKVNFLGFKLNSENQDKFQQEKAIISNMLDSDHYETLMRLGFKGIKAQIKYQGADDSIDEVIIFATDPTKGFALIRVLGDDMKPENIAKLAKSVEKGTIDLDILKKIVESFD